MAFSFGDGFDCYAAPADAINGYWDTMPTSFTLVSGRFAGSRALSFSGGLVINLMKSSGVNDAVHHLVVAVQQVSALSGTTACGNLQLLDGATAQCSVVFRSDGAILLTSGGPTGTTLATYTGAITAINTWYAFEFEIVINNTAGSFTVRKNGNTSNDFTLGSLNTRGGTANNYANRLQVGSGSSAAATQYIDDLFWRSDASSVAWMGDIRCYTRMPASDASVQFSRTPNSYVQATSSALTVFFDVANSFYTPMIAAYDGTVGTGTVSFTAGFTGTLKCSVFNGTVAGPTTILASATSITNPTTGSNTITFPTPFTITKGTQYWMGFASSISPGSPANSGPANSGKVSTTVGYSTFPAASPTVSNNNAPTCSWMISTTTNYEMVSEAQQDATTSYVYESTPAHADFYGIGSIASTPVSTIAVVTRAYMQKSDAGSRTAAVQLKSGATTVASPTLTLTTSGWLWAYRTDIVDPNTSAAWTAAAVNAAQIGPSVVS
jgi:hypothetical protein